MKDNFDIKFMIDMLGKSFRGLWKSIIVWDSFGVITRNQEWTVTYIFEEDYVETPSFKCPENALLFAIGMKRLNG
jgi:hypothetical protein